MAFRVTTLYQCLLAGLIALAVGACLVLPALAQQSVMLTSDSGGAVQVSGISGNNHKYIL